MRLQTDPLNRCCAKGLTVERDIAVLIELREIFAVKQRNMLRTFTLLYLVRVFLRSGRVFDLFRTFKYREQNHSYSRKSLLVPHAFHVCLNVLSLVRSPPFPLYLILSLLFPSADRRLLYAGVLL